jgi:hypothetical protein
MEILSALYNTATLSFWLLLFAYFLINIFNIKDNRYIKRHQIMLCLAINEILTIPYLIYVNNYFSLILSIVIMAMWTHSYLKDRKYI